jgi:hypothetical protein
MASLLTSEVSRRSPHRKRWISIAESPFGRTKTYELIESMEIVSVNVTLPGHKKGQRLIDGDSLDAYLERLASEQAAQRKAEKETVVA